MNKQIVMECDNLEIGVYRISLLRDMRGNLEINCHREFIKIMKLRRGKLK
jgi:hypothetical protein